MRKVIGLILLAILWGRYLYAVEFPQVIWLYSSQTAKKIVINRFDSCLVSHGVETHHFPLHLNNQNACLENLTDSLHLYLTSKIFTRNKNLILFPVEECTYIAMKEAVSNKNVIMLFALSGVFLNGSDYLYNKVSLAENIKRENHQVVDVDKTDYLRNVFQIIQKVKFEKKPKKGKYLTKAEFSFFTNSLARSFARFDSGQILQQMKCPIYAIYTNQDLSWDFLSHQEFLQCQLNQTDILYETLGPMQYSVDEQKVGVFDFLINKILKFYDNVYEE